MVRLFERFCIVVCVVLAILIIAKTAYTHTQPKELVKVVHKVKAGESLSSIAAKFCPDDVRMDVFTNGIYEFNYEAVFMARERRGGTKKMVFPGDELHIRFLAVVDKD